MSAPHAPSVPQADYSRKWWVLLSVAMGTFLSTIDSSIVNVALPTLEDKLNTRFATVQWVVVAYLLVVTSLILGVARLGDMIGKKRIYLTGMAVFTVASLLCGLAPSVGFLIAFRVVQGLGAVMMQALGMAIVTEAFPRTERGRALGIMGTVVSLGISIGPTVGGLLIGTVGWRAIFLVNLPVGIVGFALVQRHVPDWRPPGGQRFDALGAALLLIALLALALGLTFGPEQGWGSAPILALLISAALGFAVFLAVEKHLAQPMVDLRLFRDPLFSISLLTGFLVFMVIAGMFVLPFYLEWVKGYDPGRVGLFLTVMPVALGLSAPIAGSLSDRYGSRGISLVGLVIVVGACLGIATLQENTSAMGYILRLLPLGLGVGIFQSPNNSAIMGAAPRERLGVASGLLSLSRAFGQVTGLPLIGAVFASRVYAVTSLDHGVDASDAPAWAIVEGVQAAFLAGAALVMIGVVLAALAFRLDRRRRVAALDAAHVPDVASD
ncbi:MAG: MFS transporter [Anaerolineae bacterium]|nr:MFS transporter [Anaerolineae bacterium]